MASILNNETRFPYSNWVVPGKGSAIFNTSERLFYSNNPEEVLYEHTADNGKFLYRDSIYGSSMIYTWHLNSVVSGGTGRAVTHRLYLYNPGSSRITVSIVTMGNTKMSGAGDRLAWRNFFSGWGQKSVSVAAGGYAELFSQQVGYNNVFGVIAHVEVKNSGGYDTGAVLIDYVYVNAAYRDNAVGQAAPKPGSTMRRGVGNGFYEQITLPVVEFTARDQHFGWRYGETQGTINDINNEDLMQLVDSSGLAGGQNDGLYGIQILMNVPVRNETGSASSFKICFGSNGGASLPLVNLNGQSSTNDDIPKPHYYLDLIDTGVIPNGSMETVSFYTVCPAMGSAPYLVGVHN